MFIIFDVVGGKTSLTKLQILVLTYKFAWILQKFGGCHLLPTWKFPNQFEMVALITSVLDKNFGSSTVESIERVI